MKWRTNKSRAAKESALESSGQVAPFFQNKTQVTASFFFVHVLVIDHISATLFWFWFGFLTMYFKEALWSAVASQ